MTTLRFGYTYYISLVCEVPCTIRVWDGDPPSPSNLKFLAIYYEAENGSPPEILQGGFPITMNGDFWMGLQSVPCVSGDTLKPAIDQTSPATPNRNFYTTGDPYGTRTPYGNYDFIFTAIRCEGSGVEEHSNEEFYLKIKPTLIFRSKEISFSYNIQGESTLKIYGLDGRLRTSKLLKPDDKKLLWKLNLPSGIYFYKLSTGNPQFVETGKFLLL